MPILLQEKIENPAMLATLITRVTTIHPDFSYEEVEEVCLDYLASITEKIKEETKMKRLVKYIEKEFELENTKIEKVSNRIYNLESIPEYLFSGKAEIASSLVKISNLTKNIEQTELFQNAELQINRQDKIALIGKNGSGKTTLLKMIIGREWEYDGIIEKASWLKIGYLSQDLFWQRYDKYSQGRDAHGISRNYRENREAHRDRVWWYALGRDWRDQ